MSTPRTRSSRAAIVAAALFVVVAVQLLTGPGARGDELQIGTLDAPVTSTTAAVPAGVGSGIIGADVAAVLADDSATPACRAAAEQLATAISTGGQGTQVAAVRRSFNERCVSTAGR